MTVAEIVKGLTRQQWVAIRWMHGEGDVQEYFLWYEGVRPWPTMANLVAKGLAETVCWEEYSYDERGYRRRLTPLGDRVAEHLAAGHRRRSA